MSKIIKLENTNINKTRKMGIIYWGGIFGQDKNGGEGL